MGTTLSPREIQVLCLVAQGHGNKQIANQLGIAAVTVKNHLTYIYSKLGASNRAHAVKLGMDLELIP